MIFETFPWWLVPILWGGVVGIIVAFVRNGTKKSTPSPRSLYILRREDLWEEEFRPHAKLHNDVIDRSARPYDQERDR